MSDVIIERVAVIFRSSFNINTTFLPKVISFVVIPCSKLNKALETLQFSFSLYDQNEKFLFSTLYFIFSHGPHAFSW
jgi:hypothetical protein